MMTYHSAACDSSPDLVVVQTTWQPSWNKQKVFINTLRPRQNGRHFPDHIFKCIFLNENVWTSLKTSLKFVPRVPINNIPALDQMMAWRHLGNKPLSEPMMGSLLMQICVTWPQWVKWSWIYFWKHDWKYICIFFHFSSLRWCKLSKSFLLEDKDLSNLHGLYYSDALPI